MKETATVMNVVKFGPHLFLLVQSPIINSMLKNGVVVFTEQRNLTCWLHFYTPLSIPFILLG